MYQSLFVQVTDIQSLTSTSHYRLYAMNGNMQKRKQ